MTPAAVCLPTRPKRNFSSAFRGLEARIRLIKCTWELFGRCLRRRRAQAGSSRIGRARLKAVSVFWVSEKGPPPSRWAGQGMWARRASLAASALTLETRSACRILPAERPSGWMLGEQVKKNRMWLYPRWRVAGAELAGGRPGRWRLGGEALLLCF